jgi:thymidylate synthase (FAD)
MPKVKPTVLLKTFTKDPEHIIADNARICYADDEDLQRIFSQEEINSIDDAKLIRSLVQMRHYSPIEHASYSFILNGISRAMSLQLVRHRIASYSQRSQRYVNESNFGFIVPPSIESAGLEERYIEMMDTIASYYQELSDGLSKFGLKGEEVNQDARYVLPNACSTTIGLTMNARELLHVFGERLCNRAQWEFRSVAEGMLDLVYPTAPNIFQYAGPECYTKGHCSQARKSCGKLAEVVSKFNLKKKEYTNETR